MTAEQPVGRAISPVVGVAILVAIVTVLAAAAGYAIFALSEETDPAPNAVMELEPTDDGVTYELQHVSGDGIAGERTRLAGVADESALHGERLTAGEKVEVVPTDSEVELYWHGSDTSYTLQTFDVDPTGLPFDAGSIEQRCPYAEQKMVNQSGDLDMNSEEIICDVTEDTDSGYSDNDIDIYGSSTLVGNIDADGDVDVDSSVVAGGVESSGNDITVTGGSDIYGDVVAQSGTNIDIDGGSVVYGDVVGYDGDVDLDSVTVTGHVYADSGDFVCNNVTVGPSEDGCGYSPRDPGDY